jgi:NACalpha-BTF3-like transcription factor
MEDGMTPTLTPVNGRVSLDDLSAMAGQLAEKLSAECDGLRAMLEGEQRLTNQIQGILDDSHERSKRLRRALAALEGTTTAPEASRASRASRQKLTRETWQASEAKTEQVYRALVALGEGRVSQIAEQAGVASETARRALMQLRAQERARITSKHAKWGTTFAAMPNTGADDAA